MSEFVINYPRSISPCKDCPDRKVGCHGGCERYIDWVESEKRKNQAKYVEHIANRKVDDYVIGQAVKRRKMGSNKYGIRVKRRT